MITTVLDIETTPLVVYCWGLKDQNIGLNQILEDWKVMAWAAKTLDSPAKDICYADTRKMSEKEILKNLWDILDKSDIVITQNGQSFDGPKLNARFIQLGFGCPSPYQHLDTYRIAKRVFEFTSNKLEYLTDKLCTKYKKLSHSKFPGMSLWRECLAGNKEAWDEMKKYNIHDVLSTEEMYNKLKAWAPETMPKPYVVSDHAVCGVCGKKSVIKDGTRVLKTGKYLRLHCTSCGTWSKGDKIK